MFTEAGASLNYVLFQFFVLPQLSLVPFSHNSKHEDLRPNREKNSVVNFSEHDNSTTVRAVLPRTEKERDRALIIFDRWGSPAYRRPKSG